MSDIRQLSASVINKIAAGEVIERPASVVKELLENSVDAGATRIDVLIEAGGTELVRVADNGHGIAPEQLTLAVASHATSKIRDADDLFRVDTLGFRGEALASIGEVSRLTLRSRTTEATAGAELEVSGGRLSDVAVCGCPVGTTIEIRDLFYNTPVRRKFMRTTQTEMGHAGEAMARLALAHPHVHFTLQHNKRQIHDLPPTEDLRGRVAALFGTDLAEGLIHVDSTDGPVRLHGFVASPSHSRGNTKMQYLLLNGRFIRDRSLQHALGEAYRGLLLSGRFPIAFLHLEIPPDAVDVNVHPTKMEVRFQDGGRIYSQLLGTLRTKFLSTDLTARVESGDHSSVAGSNDAQRTAQLKNELVQWAKGSLPEAPTRQEKFDLAPREVRRQPLDLTQLGQRWSPPATSQPPNSGYRAAAPSSGEELPEDPPALAEAARAIQAHNRYLITESDDGVLVIDQHALHERILYEMLREKVLAGGLDTQKLLVPEPVDLSPEEAAAILESRELLAELGMQVEAFGGDTVLVSSYPAMLANISPSALIRELAEMLTSGGKVPERRDLIDEVLHMISCKAAIKAGDRLTSQEVTALLEQRHLVQDSHHCPHGRPTALVFSREELDRQFLRK
jgi:DNA mismatch repair protein MutL